MSFHLLPESTIVNRRGFLGSLAALGAAASLGARNPEADDAYIALLSDTHVAADPAKVSRGQKMADNLKRVVSEILDQKTPPAGVFIDGDLALLDGQAGDYRTLLGLLEPIRAKGLPIHLALGNHDDRANFRDVLKGTLPLETKVEEKHVGVVDVLGLRLMVLDSLDQVNVTPGVLGEKQLGWLGKALDAKPEIPTIIFVHHNLKNKAEAGLVDDEALLEVIQPKTHVKAVVFGHTHVWDVRQDKGLHLVNLPAIGYPFANDQPIGWTKLRATDAGARLELFAIGGDKSKHGQKIDLAWRKA